MASTLLGSGNLPQILRTGMAEVASGIEKCNFVRSVIAAANSGGSTAQEELEPLVCATSASGANLAAVFSELDSWLSKENNTGGEQNPTHSVLDARVQCRAKLL